MKILNVVNSIGEKTGSGATERVVQLSLHLTSRGNDVEILTTNYDFTQERLKELRQVKISALSCVFNSFFLPVPNLSILIPAVKNADLIHLANHWSPINIMAFIMAKLFSKPIVVSPMGALKIMGQGTFTKKLFNFFGGSYLISGADGYIAISENEIEFFVQYGVSPNSIDVIANGIEVNIKDFSPNYFFEGNFNYLTDKKYILFMGRLHSLKGPDMLMKAFLKIAKQFPDWHLVIAGHDEGLEESLRHLATKSDFKNRIHLIGYLNQDIKYSFIQSCKLFVVPSQFEAMSIVALEAGIMGIPVLLTDQCGFDDIQKVNGGLVVPASIHGITEGLIKLLGDESELKIKGTNLQKFVLDHFSWKVIAAKHEELFIRVFKKHY